MKAVVLNRHGGPEVLESVEIDRPEPGPGEVRIAIKAISLNHLDIWVRKGGPAFHLEYPHRLGSDIAGVVDAVGAGVDGIAVGDRATVNPGLSCQRCEACLHGRDNFCPKYRILGENAQGGYAEAIVVPAVNVAPYPGELPFEQAAAVLLPFMTAWQMLVERASVKPAEWVLVHGAASGVGVAAVQIARMHGARVIATASTKEKLDCAAELGAEHLVNYKDQDFVAEVRRITGRGVDVVFEHVGGDTFARSIKATANGGRIVTCGATSGPKPQVDLRHVFFRQISILGSTMASKGGLLEVLSHVEAGRLRPVVHDVLPLERAGEAHTLLEQRQAVGKVVLVP